MCSKPELLTNNILEKNSCKTDTDENSEELIIRECISNEKEEDISNQLFDKYCLDKEETHVKVSVEKPSSTNSFVYTKSENPRNKHWFKTYSDRKKTKPPIKESPSNISTNQYHQENISNPEATVIHKNDIQRSNNFSSVQLSNKLPLSNRRVKIVFPPNFVNKPKILDTKGNLITKPPTVLCAEINLLKDFPSMLPPLSSKLNIVSLSHISKSINPSKELNVPIKEPFVDDEHKSKIIKQKRLKTDLCTKSVHVDVYQKVPNKTSHITPDCSSTGFTDNRKDVAFKVKSEFFFFDTQSKNDEKITFKTIDPIVKQSEALRSKITNRLKKEEKNNVMAYAKNIEVLANPMLPEIQLPIEIDKSEASTIQFNHKTREYKDNFLENPKRYSEKNKRKFINESEEKSNSIKNITVELKTEISDTVDQVITQSKDSKIQKELRTIKREDIVISGENSLQNVHLKETTIPKYSKMNQEPFYKQILETNYNSKQEILRLKQRGEKDLGSKKDNRIITDILPNESTDKVSRQSVKTCLFNKKDRKFFKENGKLNPETTEKSTEKTDNPNPNKTSYCLLNQENHNNSKLEISKDENNEIELTSNSETIKPSLMNLEILCKENNRLKSKIKNLEENEFTVIRDVPKEDSTCKIFIHKEIKPCKNINLDIGPQKSQMFSVKTLDQKNTEPAQIENVPYVVMKHENTNECKVRTFKNNLEHSEKIELQSKNKDHKELICQIKTPEKNVENKAVNENNISSNESIKTSKSISRDQSLKFIDEIVGTNKQHNTEIENIIEESACKQNETGNITVCKTNNVRSKNSNIIDHSAMKKIAVENSYNSKEIIHDIVESCHGEENNHLDLLNRKRENNQCFDPSNVQDLKEEKTVRCPLITENQKNMKETVSTSITTKPEKMSYFNTNDIISKAKVTLDIKDNICMKESCLENEKVDCHGVKENLTCKIKHYSNTNIVTGKTDVPNITKNIRTNNGPQVPKIHQAAILPQTTCTKYTTEVNSEDKNSRADYFELQSILEGNDVSLKNEKEIMEISLTKNKRCYKECSKQYIPGTVNETANQAMHRESRNVSKQEQDVNLTTQNSESIDTIQKFLDSVNVTESNGSSENFIQTKINTDFFSEKHIIYGNISKSSVDIVIKTKINTPENNSETKNNSENTKEISACSVNILNINVDSEILTKSCIINRNITETNTSSEKYKEIIVNSKPLTKSSQNITNNCMCPKNNKETVNSCDNISESSEFFDNMKTDNVISEIIAENIGRSKTSNGPENNVISKTIITSIKMDSNIFSKGNSKNVRESSMRPKNVLGTRDGSKNTVPETIIDTNQNSEYHKNTNVGSENIIVTKKMGLQNLKKNATSYKTITNPVENTSLKGTNSQRTIENPISNFTFGIVACKNPPENIIAEKNTILENVTETSTSIENMTNGVVNIACGIVAISKNPPENRTAEKNASLTNVTKTGNGIGNMINGGFNTTADNLALSKSSSVNIFFATGKILESITETDTSIENMTNDESNVRSGTVATPKNSSVSVIAETNTCLKNGTSVSDISLEKMRYDELNNTSNIVAVSKNSPENILVESNSSLENATETSTIIENMADNELNFTSDIVALSKNFLENILAETKTSFENARPTATSIEYVTNDEINMAPGIVGSKNSPRNIIAETDLSLENAAVAAPIIEKMANEYLNITLDNVVVYKNYPANIMDETNTSLENATVIGTSIENMTNDGLNISSGIVGVSENPPENIIAETITNLENATITGTSIENVTSDILVSENSPENISAEINTILENDTKTFARVEKLTNDELCTVSGIVAVSKSPPKNKIAETNPSLENVTEIDTCYEPRTNDKVSFTSVFVAVSEKHPENKIAETRTILDNVTKTGTTYEPMEIPENDVENCVFSDIIVVSENLPENIIADINTGIENFTKTGTRHETVTVLKSNGKSCIKTASENPPQGVIDNINTKLENVTETVSRKIPGNDVESSNMSGIVAVSQKMFKNVMVDMDTTLAHITENNTSPEPITMPKNNSKFFFRSCNAAVSRNLSENVITDENTNLVYNKTSGMSTVSKDPSGNVKSVIKTSFDNVTVINTCDETGTTTKNSAESILSSGSVDVNHPGCIIADINTSHEKVTETAINHKTREIPENINPSGDIIINETTIPVNNLEFHMSDETVIIPENNPESINKSDRVTLLTNLSENIMGDLNKSVEYIIENSTSHEIVTRAGKDSKYVFRSGNIAICTDISNNIISDINTKLENLTETGGKTMKISECNAQSNISSVIVTALNNPLENISIDEKKLPSTFGTKNVDDVLGCASETNVKKGCESQTILKIEKNKTKINKIVSPNIRRSQLVEKKLCPKSKKYRFVDEIVDKKKGLIKTFSHPYKHTVIAENVNEGNTTFGNVTDSNVQEYDAETYNISKHIKQKKLCPKSKKYYSAFCKNRSNLKSPSNLHIIINESNSKAKNLQKSSNLDSLSNIPKDTMLEVNVTEDLIAPDVAIIPEDSIKINSIPKNRTERPTTSRIITTPKMITDIIFDADNVVGTNLIPSNLEKCNDILKTMSNDEKFPETICHKSLNNYKYIPNAYSDTNVPEESNTKCSLAENTLHSKKYLEMYGIQDCFVNLDVIQIEGNSVSGENLDLFLKNNTLVCENSTSKRTSAMSITNQKECSHIDDISTIDHTPEKIPHCNKDNELFTIINLKNKKYVIKRLNFTSQSDNSDDNYSVCNDRDTLIECASESNHIGIDSYDGNSNISFMKSVRVMLEPIDHLLPQENSIKLNESILQKLLSKDVPQSFHNSSQAHGQKYLEYPQSNVLIKLHNIALCDINNKNDCITPIENTFFQDNQSLNEEEKLFDSPLPLLKMSPKNIKRNSQKNDATVNQSSKVIPNNPHIIQMPEELEEKQKARNKQIELLLNTNRNTCKNNKKLFPKSKENVSLVSKNKSITSCPENYEDLQIIYEGVGSSTSYQNKPISDSPQFISQNEKIIKSEFDSFSDMHKIVPNVIKPQSMSKNNIQGEDNIEKVSLPIDSNISKQCTQKSLDKKITKKYLNASVHSKKKLDTKNNIKIIEYTSKMDKISENQISLIPSVHKGSTSILNIQNSPAPPKSKFSLCSEKKIVLEQNCTLKSIEKTAAVDDVLTKTMSPSELMNSEKLNNENVRKNTKKITVSTSNLSTRYPQPKKVTLEYLDTAKKSFVIDKEPTFISQSESVLSKSKTNILRKSNKKDTQLFRSKTMNVTSTEKYLKGPKNVLGIKGKCKTELSSCSVITSCNTLKVESEKKIVKDEGKSNSAVIMEYETDLSSSSINNAFTKTPCNTKIPINVEKITVENQEQSNSKIAKKKLVLSSTLEKETILETKCNTSKSYSFNSVDENLKNSYPTAQSNLLNFQNLRHDNSIICSNENNSIKITLDDHCSAFPDNFPTPLKCTSSFQNICSTLDPTMQLDINVPILPENFSYEETVLEDLFPGNDLCYNTQPFLKNNLRNNQFDSQGVSIQSNSSVTIMNSEVSYFDSDNFLSTPTNTVPNQRNDTFSSRNNKSDQPTSSTSLSVPITNESKIFFAESNSVMNISVLDVSSSSITPCPSPTLNPCGSPPNLSTSSYSRPVKYALPHFSSSPHLYISASNSISIPSIISEIGSPKSSVISPKIPPVSHKALDPPVSFHKLETNNFNVCANNPQTYELSKEDMGKTTASFETNPISSDMENTKIPKSLSTDQNTAESPRKPQKRKSTCTIFDTYDAVIESVVKYSNEFYMPVETKAHGDSYKNINEIQLKPLPPIQSLNSQLPIFQLSNSSCIDPRNTSEIFLSDSSFKADSTSPNTSIVHNSNQSDVVCNFSPYSSHPSIMNQEENSCNQIPISSKLEEQSLIEGNYVGAEFQALTEWLLNEYLEIPKESEACPSLDNLEVNKTASIERISSQLEAFCEANNENNLIISLPSTSLQNSVPASIDSLRTKSPTPSYQESMKNNSSQPTKSTACFDEASNINHVYELLHSKSKQNAAWNQLNPSILKVKSLQSNVRTHRRLSHKQETNNSNVENSLNISPSDSLQYLKQAGKRPSKEKLTIEQKKQKVDIPSTTANHRNNKIAAQSCQVMKMEETNGINHDHTAIERTFIDGVTKTLMSTPQPLKQRKQISRERNTFKEQNSKTQHTAITHLNNHIDEIVAQVSQEVKSEAINKKMTIDLTSFEISHNNKVTKNLNITNHSLKQTKQNLQGKIIMEPKNSKLDDTSSVLNKHNHEIIAHVSQEVKTKETNKENNVKISKATDPVQSEQPFIKGDRVEMRRKEICGDQEKIVVTNNLSKVKCCLLQRENKQSCQVNTEKNNSNPHLTLTLVPSGAITDANSSKTIPPQSKQAITETKREHKIIPFSSNYKMDHKYENKHASEEKQNVISSIIEQQLQTVKKFCLEKSWRNHVSPLGKKVENVKQTKKNRVFQTGDFCIKNHDLFKPCPPIWRLDVERKKIDEYVYATLDEDTTNGFNFMFKQNSSIGNFLSEDTNLWIKIYFSVEETGMKFDQLKNEEILEKFVLERSFKGSLSFKPIFIFYVQVIISQAMNSNFIPYILQSPKDQSCFYEPWVEINNILNRYMKTINLCFILYDEHIIEALIQYPYCALIENEHNSIQDNDNCPLCGASICNVKLVLTGSFYDRKNLMSIDNKQDKKETYLCKECSELSVLFSKIIHFNYSVYQLALKHLKAQSATDPSNVKNDVNSLGEKNNNIGDSTSELETKTFEKGTVVTVDKIPLKESLLADSQFYSHLFSYFQSILAHIDYCEYFHLSGPHIFRRRIKNRYDNFIVDVCYEEDEDNLKKTDKD